MRVAIVGGGVIGFSCALKILQFYKSISQSYPIEIVVVTEQLTPFTTGDGSAGLWGPVILANTKPQLIHQWGKGTHDFFERIWLSTEAAEAGVCLLPCVIATTESEPLPKFWLDIVYGATALTAAQLNELSKSTNRNFHEGLQFVTYTAEPVKLLPYLMKKFAQLGGKVLQHKVQNLEEFASKQHFDIICNCTGFAAKHLVKDEKTYAVRGQVMRIKANWIYSAFLDYSDDGNYIIPNVDTVVLGGTHQVADENQFPTTQDKMFIQNGCIKIMSGIKHATHLFDWAGLRPGRTEVRLEKTYINGTLVIHNYGHGGSGVTLCWGCAENVLDIIKNEHKSKL